MDTIDIPHKEISRISSVSRARICWPVRISKRPTFDQQPSSTTKDKTGVVSTLESRLLLLRLLLRCPLSSPLSLSISHLLENPWQSNTRSPQFFQFLLGVLFNISSTMNSTLSSSSALNFTKRPSFSLLSRPPPPVVRFPTPKPHEDPSLRRNTIRACSIPDPRNPPKNPFLQKVRDCAGAAVLVGAAVSFIFSTEKSAARAEPPPAAVETEQSPSLGEIREGVQEARESQSSPLTELLESDPESVGAMRKLLQQKLENGEDQEALGILRRLVAAQPEVTEWKFLLARLFGEIGDTEGARKVFEEILAANPLSFEALFENALLMDRCGEGEAVIKRLEEALRIAEEENKEKEARDVRLIMAQIQFLQKNVEGALKSYQDLAKEDPNDFRPYFCQGMIYSLLDKNAEAKEQFAKYRELSPKKFDVEGYLRTPLSRMKLFGTDEAN